MPARRRPASLRRSRASTPTAGEVILDTPQASALDLIDQLLNRGVMASGEVTLGVAGVDLIYLRLSTLLCAADRVLPVAAPRRRRRHRGSASRD